MKTAIAALLTASFFAQSWQLLKLASNGQSPYEHAAFIVVDADGSERFVIWPFHREFYEATYNGPVPANAAAIIHTHPNSAPYPSEGDAELAARTGLPVYVLTRTVISRTTGHGVEVVRVGDWRPR